MKSLTALVVTYNSSTVLSACLNGLTQGRATNDAIVVVDSGSADAARLRPIAARHNAELVELKENVGYGSANNRGASEAQSPWIAIVNPDVHVTFDDLRQLVDVAERNDLVCIGPRIVNGAGVVQPPIRTELQPPWRHARFAGRTVELGTVEVPAVSGSCFVVRAEEFRSVGGFDESFFMFAEEIDLHSRLRAAGGRVGYCELVTATTEGGGSSEGVASRWSLVERDVSHIRYVRKHFSWIEAAVDFAYRSIRVLYSPRHRPRRLSYSQLIRGLSARGTKPH